MTARSHAKPRHARFKPEQNKVRVGLPGEGPNRFAVVHARYREKTVYVPANNNGANAGYFRVSENVDANLMDAWIIDAEGFDGGHLWAAHLCRSLWRSMPKPTAKIVDWEDERHSRSARRLAEIKRRVGPDWAIFENAMRWNEPMGYAGSRLAMPRPEHIARTKQVVRRVLEIIR